MQLSLVTGFHTALYPPGAVFGPRRLMDFEFVWMLEGNAVYHWNTEEHPAPEGSIVLCRPPATDGFRWDTERRTRHAYFHFQIPTSLPHTWTPVSEWPVVRRPVRPDDLLYSLFRHLLVWNDSGDTTLRSLLAAALFTAFITGQTVSVEAPAPPLPEAVHRALTFIRYRLDEMPEGRLSLQDIAHAACVTPEYLCRLFRKATGHTPAETVRLLRLDRAVTLLTHTNYSIAEIAVLTGFDSPFHFSRSLKAVYGQSPRQLRQSVINGAPAPVSRLVLHSA